MSHAPDSTPTAIWALRVGAVAFVLFIAYLVASSLTQREAPTFPLSTNAPRDHPPEALLIDTVTLNASDADRWHYFSFALGTIVPESGPRQWDLAFRRYRIVPAYRAADLGVMPFDSIAAPPDTGFVTSRFDDDTLNAAIDRWYRYSMITHLLDSEGHTYVLQSPDGRYAKLEVLSYYCPDLIPGCLTFRYAYQPDSTGPLR